MIDIIFEAVFADNLALSYFLGMCTFMAVSKRIGTAFGLGIAIIIVLTITVPMNNLVFQYVLNANALQWLGINELDLSFLVLIAFIGLIAAMVQILEVILQRFVPELHRSLGVFLPLLTVNCAILGASLFMVERNYGFYESAAYGFGGGLGWALAIILFAAIRQRLDEERIPPGLRGLGIAFIITGLLSMGFSAFSGITLS